MNILLRADNDITVREELSENISNAIRRSAERFSDRITRLKVHLGDENSQKEGGDDKRCMIEAHLEGRQPLAVTHHATSLDRAVRGATDTIGKMMDSHLDKLCNHKNFALNC